MGLFLYTRRATRSLHINQRDLPLIALFAITGVTVFYGTCQMAIRGGGAALAAALLYTSPAWVSLVARLIFKGPLTQSKIFALASTLIGVARAAGGAAAFKSDGPRRLSA